MHERVEPNAGIPLAGYDFLGRGPRAAGSGGWARSGDLA